MSTLAQNKIVRLQPTVINNGLPNGAVYTLLQDPDGFIWFGTHSGLSRYDGVRFINMYFEPNNPEGLSSDNISRMVIGPDGYLWIATWGGGLNRIDPSDFSVTHFRHKAGNPETVSDDRIQTLIFDHSNMLWVGTAGGGLTKMDPVTGICRRYTSGVGEKFLPNPRIWSLLEDSDKKLWVGTSTGLVLMDRERQTFEHFPDLSIQDDRHEIRALLQDREGTLWVGSNHGLSKFDRRTGQFTRFKPYTDASHPGQNIINTLYEDTNGRLWVGLLSGGLCQFDRKDESFIFVVQKGEHIFDDIRAITQDTNGNLWVGTRGAGVRLFNPRLSFAHYGHNPMNNNSLSNNRPLSFAEDGFGNIWVGTEFGLNQLVLGSGSFKRYMSDPKSAGSIAHNRVQALLEDSRGTLWVGTSNGLSYRVGASDTFETLRKNPKDSKSLSNNQVQALLEDRTGALWVGTLDGLSKLLNEKGEFQNYAFDPETPKTLSHQSVLSMGQDLRGDLWIGTSKGLNLFRLGGREFDQYYHDPKDPNSLSNDTIYWVNSSPEGHDDRLWLATHHGLNAFDPVSGKARSWFEEDGLPSNVIHGVQEDDNGNLWVSTNLGMCIFDPTADQFSRFNVQHGIQANYFFPSSTFKDSRGRIYFGGINGFNAFNPEYYSRIEGSGPTIIADVFLDGSKDPLPRVNPSVTPTHSLKIQYALLDYTKTDLNTFHTLLEGFDKTWQSQETQTHIRYQNLPSGNYKFLVKGTNSEGLKTSRIAELAVRVPAKEDPKEMSDLVYIIAIEAVIILILLYFLLVRDKPKSLDAVGFSERIDAYNEASYEETSKEQESPLEFSGDAPHLEEAKPDEDPVTEEQSTKDLALGPLDDWIQGQTRHLFSGFEGGPCKILVIDDQIKNHLALDSLLGNLGFEVISVESGHQGLLTAARESPGVILVDVVLPDMDGMQLARLLRRAHPRATIIAALSGESELQYSPAQLEHCTAFFKKPIEVETLLSCIEKHSHIVLQG